MCIRIGFSPLLYAMLLVGVLSQPNWQPWEVHADQCSTTCGEGVRCRRRMCIDPPTNGKEVNVDYCAGGEKASRECLPCKAYVVCPTNGGWGEWNEWSGCVLDRVTSSATDLEVNKEFKAYGMEAQEVLDKQSQGLTRPQLSDVVPLDPECGKGVRKRTRECNSPKPSTEGLLCGEEVGRFDTENCTLECTSEYDFLATVKQILTDELMTQPNQVVYVNQGGLVTLDCANDAYTVAQESTKPNQLLQIQWRRNNHSVTSIVSRLEHFIQKSKEIKGLLKSKPGMEEETLESSQLRSVGTQLTIDPVDGKQIGVYSCYMVLDNEHYLMRTFTLLSRQLRVHLAMESEETLMQTNAETFIDASLPRMEAAMVRWYHNGIKNREHMLLDWHERSWKLTLAYRYTGVWECYIVLDEKHWKTNEFLLQISNEASFLQKFDSTYFTYFFATCALVMYAVFGFPLAVITLRHREDNWITAEEQRCIEYVRQINYLYMARYVRKIS